MAETWCPFATRLDGPPEKQGYPAGWLVDFPEGVTERQGIGGVYHSAVGDWDAMMAVLFAPTSVSWESWTFSGLKDGQLFQHYPLEMAAAKQFCSGGDGILNPVMEPLGPLPRDYGADESLFIFGIAHLQCPRFFDKLIAERFIDGFVN